MLSIAPLPYFQGSPSEPETYTRSVDLRESDRALYDAVRAGAGTPVPTETPSPSPTPLPPLLARDVRYRVVIERIGVDAPVVTFGMDSEGAPEVPLNGADVAWYDFSAHPGTGSNAVFAGHVGWSYAQAVFWNLKGLQPNDIIRLAAEDGTELVYSVSENFLVDPDDPDSLSVMAPTATDSVTLITCGGTWLSDAGEIFGGHYTNRVIVRAQLVEAVEASIDPTHP